MKRSDEEDTEVEVDDRTPEERHPDLDHPTHDKRHIRSLHGGAYRGMWVYCEMQAGGLVDMSREMLGRTHELINTCNDDYTTNGRVVAVLIGADVSRRIEDVIVYDTGVVVVHEDARLECLQHKPYTEIFCDVARTGAAHQNFEVTDGRDESWHGYDKPRHALFPTTNNGRNLSTLIQAELDSDLANDYSGLYIAEEVTSNPVKTGVAGKKREFQRALHMKRPDFSGFKYSTILCIDNPTQELHPQSASAIPGSFDLSEPDAEHGDLVVKHDTPLSDDWFRITVIAYDRLDKDIDLTDHEVVIAVDRGMGDNLMKGIGLTLDFVDQFGDAEVDVAHGIVTGSFNFDGHVKQYTREDKQIGRTEQVVAPKLYIAAGISSAVQHEVGMDESDTIIAVNTDPDARIRNFSDYFIKDGLFEAMPRLATALKEGRFRVAVASDGGRTASTPPAGTSDGGTSTGATAGDQGESR